MEINETLRNRLMPDEKNDGVRMSFVLIILNLFKQHVAKVYIQGLLE